MTKIEKAIKQLTELLRIVCNKECEKCKYDLLCELLGDFAYISMTWMVGEEE